MRVCYGRNVYKYFLTDMRWSLGHYSYIILSLLLCNSVYCVYTCRTSWRHETDCGLLQQKRLHIILSVIEIWKITTDPSATQLSSWSPGWAYEWSRILWCCAWTNMTGEALPPGSNTFANARLDVSCRNFWTPLDKVYTDVRIFIRLLPMLIN